MSIEINKLKNILEAAMMAIAKPMNIEQMMTLFEDENRPSISKIKDALKKLQEDCDGRGVELKEVASGYRYQARQDYAEWLSRLWEEKPAKYSRAYLETLALIAYRQPVTRAEIEDVRGVGVSSSIVKTMLEREWIRVVGHRDVPGRPSLYATTKQFLDYFNMKSLDELPSLAEIRDLDDLNPELGLSEPGQIDEQDESTTTPSQEQIELEGDEKLQQSLHIEEPDLEESSLEESNREDSVEEINQDDSKFEDEDSHLHIEKNSLADESENADEVDDIYSDDELDQSQDYVNEQIEDDREIDDSEAFDSVRD